MSVSLRRFGGLAVAGLAVLGALSLPAQAAPLRFGYRPYPTPNYGALAASSRINPNFLLAPGLTISQYAGNIATLGQAYSQIPPYMMGYNPYPQAVNYGPSFPAITPFNPYLGAGAANPYALSTAGVPLGGVPAAASLATSPYSAYGGGGGGYGLSTVPGGAGGVYGSIPPPSTGILDPYAGSTLRGVADVVNATGQYNMNIQQARILREQARQAAVETRRKLAQEELDRERNRPTAQDVRDRDREADLNRARRDPPEVDISSGRALNDLLRSVQAPGKALNRAPTIPLTEDTLKNINVANEGSRGNVGLLKDGDLKWPMPLRAAEFEEPRNDLNKKLALAVQQIKEKDPVERSTLNDIHADVKAISDKLAANVTDMAPSEYIEARRYLNQVRDAVRALEDPNVANYFNNTWSARGETVGELVNNMKGMRFAPATPGKEAAYRALYQALQQFEAGLQTASK